MPVRLTQVAAEDTSFFLPDPMGMAKDRKCREIAPIHQNKVQGQNTLSANPLPHRNQNEDESLPGADEAYKLCNVR